MIQAVLLDVDGTLLDFEAGSRQAVRRCFDEFHLPFREETYPVFQRINDRLWLDLEQGLLTRTQLHQIRWNRIFQELGLSADASAFERRFLELLRECVCPTEGALELVKYLSSRYLLCIASNSALDHQVCRLTKCGIYPYIRHLFVSEEIGFPKPSSGFFDFCADALAPIPRREMLLIGDSLTADIAGGVSAGILTCWFNPRRLPCTLPVSPDYTVERLSEITRLL